ncbi:arsenate reductase [Reichenbachiella agariperforans]|uniref:Arsenate reductase n=1 Tax=Reichenbachiella agariperforans TaxID=156994 RepID=A0A1M6Q8K1_REIAG|nr:protein-tyrosine-phosphatase [Reichenbachiella agariperforans]SHK16437.1 arsenate reductase [Reichenbachiella agariperforans]
MNQQKTNNWYPALAKAVEQIDQRSVSEERREVLQVLIDYIQKKVDEGQPIHLNFICTHNSRRSQFSQVWAQTAADRYGVSAHCYSGGVEVTAFNERAVASIERSGFQVSSVGEGNPKYTITHSESGNQILAFSKLFDDPVNTADQFAAIMTCSHADDNCPFIPGTEQRIPVRYEDPKAFDDTPKEVEMYDERSHQIASEMFYVFSQIKS